MDKLTQNKIYTVSISIVAFLFIVALFFTPSGRKLDIVEKTGVIFLLTFVFISYLRMYMIYKLEKLTSRHNFDSFIDFFNEAFLAFRIDFIIPLLPYFKKYKTRKLEVIRHQVNLLTLGIYIFAGIGFYIAYSYK